MTPRQALRRPAPGFTLIELVVVLAILAAVAALVLPAVGRGLDGLRVRREADRVAGLLREARLLAVTRREQTRVTLDRARSAVMLIEADTDARERGVVMPPGLRLSVAAGRESLTFSPRGLTQEARWIVEGPAGRRFAVAVDAVSGRVTVRPES
jgi:general secretion pathway protein H